jgi:hypothetical protein
MDVKKIINKYELVVEQGKLNIKLVAKINHTTEFQKYFRGDFKLTFGSCLLDSSILLLIGYDDSHNKITNIKIREKILFVFDSRKIMEEFSLIGNINLSDDLI